MAKSQTVGVGVVQRNHGAADKASTVAIEDAVKRDRAASVVTFNTLPKKVARSHLVVYNRRVEALVAAFPIHSVSHSVDQFFEFAEGGPLYVDLPRHPFDVDTCRKKAHAMRAAGLRYIYLAKDDTFETAILQLEGKLK